jgi:hypothetical protein
VRKISNDDLSGSVLGSWLVDFPGRIRETGAQRADVQIPECCLALQGRLARPRGLRSLVVVGRAIPRRPSGAGESVSTMLRRLSRRVLRAASREVSASASPSAPALVASPPWLAPWRVASLSTSARAGARGTRESAAADEAERRKRQRRAARRADRQHLRAWASDDERWDEPHLGAPRPPSSGARRRRVADWADEVSADARANEAFAKEAREMGWSGAGTLGGPKGGGAARVKYKHRNERDARRRRGRGGESPRDVRRERRDRERDHAHARDEPFFREDAGWYADDGGTRRTDAHAMGKRAARRAAREAAEAAEAEEFWRRFEERVFQERLRAAFHGHDRGGFGFGYGAGSGFGFEGFHEYEYFYTPRDRSSGANRSTGTRVPVSTASCAHCAALDIAPGTNLDAETLKASLRASAKRWHPDAHASAEDKAAAEAKFKRCYDAYDALVARL